MKQNNNFKYIASIFVALSLLIMSACGNNGQNNSSPAPVVNGFQQCVNCQAMNGPVIFTAESSDYTGTTQLHWAFAGQNMTAQYYNSPGNYTGMVVSTGSLLISQNLNLGFCGIPPGSYSLATLQPGQWSYGIVSGLILQAYSGGLSLQLSFNGQVSSPGYLSGGQFSSSTSPVGRMFGNLQVLSINGQPCQQMIDLQ
jgi:hypothetical protein